MVKRISFASLCPMRHYRIVWQHKICREFQLIQFDWPNRVILRNKGITKLNTQKRVESNCYNSFKCYKRIANINHRPLSMIFKKQKTNIKTKLIIILSIHLKIMCVLHFPQDPHSYTDTSSKINLINNIIRTCDSVWLMNFSYSNFS